MPVPQIELYLFAMTVLAAIISLTVLGALRIIDGSMVGGLIAAITAASGVVTGIATLRTPR